MQGKPLTKKDIYSSPLPTFVSQVLFEHRHTCSFTHRLWLHSCCTGAKPFPISLLTPWTSVQVWGWGGGQPIIRLSVFKTQKMAWGRSCKAVLLSWPSVHWGLSVWWPLWPSLNCSLFHLPKKKKKKLCSPGKDLTNNCLSFSD